MLGLLKDHGYVITNEFAHADVIIVNTCGFILPAKQESIDTILSLAEYKITGKCKMLVVTGCLVQKYRQELLEEIPEIDGVLGTSDFREIGTLLDTKLKSSSLHDLDPDRFSYENRYLTTPRHTAYVKIAEGCDNRCTFCLIPELRGGYQSRPMESIILEARKLVSLGVKEINLIAQDTTSYGEDLYGERKLPELLERLAQEKIAWIRVLYCYPVRISPELLKVMGKYPNICRYLDMPIQHSDDHILKKMGRKEHREFLEQLIKRIRNTMPDIALRTTLMVGFPGETEEQYQSLLDFVSEQKFDWLGVFTYSQEEDTPAASLPEQIPEQIKEDRYHRLMSLQSQISLEEKQKWIGKTISVLIEGKSSDNPEYFIGRSQYQAPDVDGVVFIKGDLLQIGDLVQVIITGADVYDLIGEIKEK
ncbi:ribosomal protein S12 methylthiotransferase RimO [Candidatus Formimonas warabiya]|uniref:Ribosomal protein uS12 methylthiotransferase RimO n=2 Tax=Formimonas warabiya TaxID=1761012 RepID=A0A3G1L146_FORW1|nr:ribosomal protein S12 methylthiotransferase RimO [Candidatus Formimonas warabiya]